MHMLERRLQILLDEERYRRVAARAKERGTSVARIIRDAIDALIPGDAGKKARAAERILAAPPMHVPRDPADLRRELDEARDRFG
jgi:hypothetical protein